MAVVVMLLKLADGTAGERTGQYLVSYDPRHREPLGGGLVTTHRRDRATEFPGPVQAWATVTGESGRTRTDGLPDKPLMVYTLMMDTVGGDPQAHRGGGRGGGGHGRGSAGMTGPGGEQEFRVPDDTAAVAAAVEVTVEDPGAPA